MPRKVVVCGAGGFIGGHLVRDLYDRKGLPILAVDKKPVPEWHQRLDQPHCENLCLDLSLPENCRRVCEDAGEVYQLAADMGGMGFIESERIGCMRNVLINVHMLEAAYRAGVENYFFSSSACAYPTGKQTVADLAPLREADAYPAEAERGYGWEKLYSEMLAQEYWAERGMKTHIARFFNIYGSHGTWDGGREKAPAAICRKVIECKDKGLEEIEIWGDGEQTRNFTWIGDCLCGIHKIIEESKLIATAINLGSSEMVTINQLVGMAEEIAGVQLKRRHKRDAPLGVRGRNTDNTFIKSVLGWEPSTTLREGMERTYRWIEKEYMIRKAARRVAQ